MSHIVKLSEELAPFARGPDPGRLDGAMPRPAPGEPIVLDSPERMTMLFAPRPSFEYLAHVGEESIRVRAATIGEVLHQAALALSGIMVPGSPPPGPEQLHEIELEAPDRAALLIAWLNELLYLAEHERWLPSRIDIQEATETRLRASAWGRVMDRAPSLVKAATWHGLRFDARDGAYEAQVLFDV